jgi:hypothetical protein
LVSTEGDLYWVVKRWRRLWMYGGGENGEEEEEDNKE